MQGPADNQSGIGQTSVILGAVFVALAGQMALAPILAPVARSLELTEWQIGAVVSTAAILPAAQSHIARVTRTEQERVRGMARMGAVQAGAMLAGAIIGGGLAGVSLMASLAFIPFLILGGLVVVLVRLHPAPTGHDGPAPNRVSPRDGRVWPFLLVGFSLFTALGFIEVLSGFIVQDRYGLDGSTTGLATGGLLLLAGVGVIASQTLIVPRTGWAPGTLLRVGCPTAAIGCAALVIDIGVPFLVLSILLIGVGIGIAAPGYTAGPSLLLREYEQGGLAGVVGATNGLTYVLAPAASTALYSVDQVLPIAIAAVLMFGVSTFVLLHPRFRQPSEVLPARSP